MQLLIVSDTLAGGMGALTRAHAAWLVADGWDVTFAAPADGPPPTPPVHVVELPAVQSLRRLGEVRRARRALRAAWQQSGSPAIVHAHGMRSFALCRAAGLPKPFVSVHGNHPSHDDPLGYNLARRAAFALLPRLARHASSGEPTSAKGWDYLPFASPMLARADELPFPAAASVPTVAWLGLLDERKQPDLFVRAVAAVAQSGVAVRGLMGGAGPRADEVRNLVAELEAPVELLGQVDALALLRDAWVLALFSRSEGTPLAVMEAMWTGRSVVASPLAGNAHLIGDTGALAATVDEAAAALRVVLADHDEAVRRGAAAAARVRTLLTPDTPWPELAARYRR